MFMKCWQSVYQPQFDWFNKVNELLSIDLPESLRIDYAGQLKSARSCYATSWSHFAHLVD